MRRLPAAVQLTIDLGKQALALQQLAHQASRNIPARLDLDQDGEELDFIVNSAFISRRVIETKGASRYHRPVGDGRLDRRRRS